MILFVLLLHLWRYGTLYMLLTDNLLDFSTVGPSLALGYSDKCCMFYPFIICTVNILQTNQYYMPR